MILKSRTILLHCIDILNVILKSQRGLHRRLGGRGCYDFHTRRVRDWRRSKALEQPPPTRAEILKRPAADIVRHARGACDGKKGVRVKKVTQFNRFLKTSRVLKRPTMFKRPSAYQ